MRTGFCICGKAGAGKNEFARLLSHELAGFMRPAWPVEFAWATGPKAELLETQGIRKEDVGGREALVRLAHTRREEDTDYWVNYLSPQLMKAGFYGVTPIITDTRYQNELSWARKHGFVTIRIDASPVDRAAALAKRGENADFVYSDHPSECELDDEVFDLRFTNPHSDMFALERAVFWAVDLFLDDVERVDSEGSTHHLERLGIIPGMFSRAKNAAAQLPHLSS